MVGLTSTQLHIAVNRGLHIVATRHAAVPTMGFKVKITLRRLLAEVPRYEGSIIDVG